MILVALKEMLRLQGISGEVSDLATALGISPNEVGAAAGNAWPVPLVAAILARVKASMDW